MDNTKLKDIELHNLKYEKLMNEDPNIIFKPRINVLSLFQKKIKMISGSVLDIGAGTGYASIWLAKNSDAKRIVCLENSDFAVKSLIPRNINYHKVQDKVEVLLGSFEELKFINHFDFVISFGSVHHSSCLFTCMKSLQKVLKNNGYLIMSEPSMDNIISNEEFIKKYENEEIFQGKKIKNYERNDRFFREAEYITSGVYSGLDLKYKNYENKINSKFFKKLNTAKDLLFKKNLIKFIILLFFYPFKMFRIKQKTKDLKKKPKSTIFFFQKKDTNYIPHIWDKLK